MLAISDLLTVCDWPMRWLFVGVASCYEKRNASLVFAVLILMRWNSALHRRRFIILYDSEKQRTIKHFLRAENTNEADSLIVDMKT